MQTLLNDSTTHYVDAAQWYAQTATGIAYRYEHAQVASRLARNYGSCELWTISPAERICTYERQADGGAAVA